MLDSPCADHSVGWLGSAYYDDMDYLRKEKAFSGLLTFKPQSVTSPHLSSKMVIRHE
ncbi:hypothetical protein [Azospirillum sp. TSO5]|uniref:hypothetical protein n=1 Tax=Azospirillum sp. TSO5 TaxID=716760 RepID=UPI001304D326|nr:hypothetical protein [Azospirillum sp. TSO5]